MIKTESELIKKYNNLYNKIHSMPNMPANQALSMLSDNELLIFVTGKTYNYGRSFKDSIENATLQLKQGREYIIKTWSSPDKEKL